MPTTINVNKESVSDFLHNAKDHPFIIPEYQRTYEWDEDLVQTLFDDLWDFTTGSSEGEDKSDTYFLGSVVSFENENSEWEVIDGQQRITSLFLLLRAIYTNLENTPVKNEEVEHFIKMIAPAIWRTNKYTGAVDYDNILLESKVLNNDGNEILRNILKTGKADPNAKDNYSKNYIKFQELYEKISIENPMMIYDFILTVLDYAIVLPITADSQDTALTIFSTLNDRGLPLSDADIFKAKIYNNLDAEKKPEFIEKWRNLDIEAAEVGESIQHLFYYYMFYLKALDKDNKSTIPGVRKYFSADKFERLYADDLMDNLFSILNIWKVVDRHKVDAIEGEPWSENKEILKTLDILTSYPNEFWKYPVIIYYLVHRKEDNFEKEFALFLNKLAVTLMTRYLITPTINAVKNDIIKLDIAIIDSSRPKFEFKDIDEQQLAANIKNPNRNATRMLLKILAYNEQDTLLPEKWEIEHIFPQKWQNNYFVNLPDATIRERIEHLGNKLPFEKKLNITASNGYFDKKKKEYALSDITITKRMADLETSDWNMDSITERDVRVCDTIMGIIRKWDDDYNKVSSASVSDDGLTEEDKALIEAFKKKGLEKYL